MVKIEASAILDDWRIEYDKKHTPGAEFDDTTLKSNSVLELSSIPAVCSTVYRYNLSNMQEIDAGTGSCWASMFAKSVIWLG